VPCYKEHKGSAACDAAYERLVLEKESQAAKESAAVLKDFESEENADENEEGYRILPDQLDRMVESKELQELLRGPRLREVIELVDAAEDREATLDRAVENNKEFSDFVQLLVETINPEGAPI